MSFPNANLYVRLGGNPLPDWAEYAPFLWGSGVNYDSDGDAYAPDQRTHWTTLDISHRRTGERLLIRPLPEDDRLPFRDADGKWHFMPARSREQVSVLSVEGDNAQSVNLAAYLTALRSGGTVVEPKAGHDVPVLHLTEGVPDLLDRLAALTKSG